jgi:hypothetical protein
MKPIIFSTEMVKAILEGRKTVTRRVVNCELNKIHGLGNPKKLLADWPLSRIIDFTDGILTYSYQTDVDDSTSSKVKSPYGKLRDVLYVRESFCQDSIAYITYKASNPEYEPEERWKPSIHMPKKFARIFLKVKDIRVERLQEITEEDCIREGIDMESDHASLCQNILDNMGCVEGATNDLEKNSVELTVFKKLWNSINGKKEGCSWEDNPYVWVVEFERIAPPE